MSFYTDTKTEKTYAPGWFLAIAEPCERHTHQMEQANATDDGTGGKHIPMGTIYPANDDTAIGIVYEDVDVTSGDMPGSVVTRGTIYAARLPVAIDTAAQTALEERGFVFVDEPTVTRPY